LGEKVEPNLGTHFYNGWWGATAMGSTTHNLDSQVGRDTNLDGAARILLREPFKGFADCRSHNFKVLR
jgi:hypothetical protein